LYLIAEPLEASAFAPFGDVLEAPTQGRRRHFDSILGDTRPNARPRFWISRVPVLEHLPAACEMMEHHPCSSQTFVPISVSRFLIAVAPGLGDGQPDLQRLRAFVGRSNQGFTYRAGVWHHGIRALDEPAIFAVLIWQDGGRHDEVFIPVSRSISIAVDPNSSVP
jgi:ureidoglycolate lyase